MLLPCSPQTSFWGLLEFQQGEDEQPSLNMTTLDHVVATHQSEWVSFSEEPLFSAPSEGATEEHFPGSSSSSDPSESSSGENPAVDGGCQDLSHSEQDDSSEKMGLISEATTPPGSPVQPTPDLASAISNWVQFEDDTPWRSTSPPHKETGELGRKSRRGLALYRLLKGFPVRGL